MIDTPTPSANPAATRFFQKTDWLGFGVTALLAFAVYAFTLAPDVTLGYSGIYATDAMYHGPSIPPGNPVWAVYGWIFIKLIPFSNIAWRLNLASAVAGALTCGLITLLVSRVGLLAVESISNFRRFSKTEQNLIRIVCGTVAGLGFGLDGCFWPKAVIADTWPLSLLLLALTICFLTRWFFLPEQRRFLLFAAFFLGLSLSESQALIPAAFGLPFLLVMADRRLGGEIFFGLGWFLWIVLLRPDHLSQFDRYVGPGYDWLWVVLATIATLVWAGTSILTRRFFSAWKISSACAVLFFTGISANFLLPIFAMTNPPVNWAYPRTVEGFFHLLSRGQFGSTVPAHKFDRLLLQLKIYIGVTADEFGLIYLVAGVALLFLLHRISSPARRWVIGLLLTWLSICLLTLIVLNPDYDRSTIKYDQPYFAASHLILAIFSGLGLMLIAVFCARSGSASSDG
jgi:hypothetical protein